MKKNKKKKRKKKKKKEKKNESGATPLSAGVEPGSSAAARNSTCSTGPSLASAQAATTTLRPVPQNCPQ